MNLLTDADLRDRAVTMNRSHRGHSSFGPRSEGHNIIGAAGEREFAKFSGLSMTGVNRSGQGDGDIDFTFTDGTTVDVKTARKPLALVLKTEKVSSAADVLVLAFGRDKPILEARLVGWAYAREVVQYPTRKFSQDGKVCHWMPRKDLHTMAELFDRHHRKNRAFQPTQAELFG